jgi:uncharacterized protein
MPVFVLVPIAFAGSLVYGLTGFGSGLITVPLASFFFELPFVLAVFALIDGLNAVRVWTSMPRAVSWPDAGRLIPGCLLGVALGVSLVLWLPSRQLMLAFGLFVCGYSLYGLLALGRLPVISRRWAWPAGLAGGLTSALFGAGGPPYAIYLSMRPLAADQIRATLAATSLVSIASRIAGFGMAGMLSSPRVWWAALLVAPASLLALWLARRQHARVSRQTLVRMIRLLLCVAGVSLVQRALAA